MNTVDWLIIATYFAVVLGVGLAVKRYTRTTTDFFLAGRALPAWVCGLAFLSANLGAQEVIGMAASGAKYGLSTSHFYWLGAIPAMVFLAVFMMPFYYGSRARSTPEYLALRFDEKTRAFNAISFAAMTTFSTGISLYAMAKLIETLHVLDAPFGLAGIDRARIFDAAILVSAAIVLVYVLLGGLRSAIVNEVLQFFMIVAGFLPLVWLGLRAVGGWSGLQAALASDYLHVWRGMSDPATNRIGIEWLGLSMGLGFVLSFGYWCTDYLVVQRAMAAGSMSAARRAPLIAAVPKMLFPLLVIVPGLIAIALPGEPSGIIPFKLDPGTHAIATDANGAAQLDYDLAIPSLLFHFFPAGLLGLGVAALLASFMSGMAGNVTAFNTVWTYDIYQAYLNRNASDRHYLNMGRVATVFGIALAVGTAYMATRFNNIMDFLQLVFAFVNAPLLATFLLGMFWTRTTGHGAFGGLLAGTSAAAIHHGFSLPSGALAGVKGGWIAHAVSYPSEMAQNFWTAIVSWSVCFVATGLISLLTRPRPKEELVGLVYSMTPRIVDGDSRWHARPAVLGGAVLLAALILNIVFR